jgi:transcriptional regulator with XRE-family HTH domain/Zn-dependent peptidase ImmA (M78 family)
LTVGAKIERVESVTSWVEVGARVRETRIAVGQTQAELAAALGLDRSMLSKIEAGDRRLDALELFRLSDATGLPVQHFLVRPPAGVVSHRAAPLTDDTDSETARQAYLLDARLMSWLRDVRQLVDLGTLRPARLLRLTGSVADEHAARAAAGDVRQRLDLGRGPLGSLAEVAERAGVFLLADDIPGDGASLTEGDLSVGLVSTRGEPGRRRATAAHELGHQLLGDEYSADLGGVGASRAEREGLITTFAAELLLPRDALATAWPVAAVGDEARTAAVSLAARYRVSWTLLVRQAEAGGLLSQRTSSRWASVPPGRAEFLEAAGWVPRPDLDRGQTAPGYSSAVLAAYRQGLILAGRAVEMLHGQTAEDGLPVVDEQDAPE